jgi:D-xylose transport system permease protein
VSGIAETPPEAASAAPSFGPAEPETLGGAIRRGFQGLRSGDLGTLPIIVALVIIAIFFQTKNSTFLSAANFVDTISAMAPPAIIGMGVVFVLLLGEIDLSIGYVAGVAGVITALMLSPTTPHNFWWHVGADIWPGGDNVSGFVVIAFVIVFCAAIGMLHGILIAKLGLPSFVVTLAGLISWSGVVLLLIASHGTVVIQNYVIFDVANKNLSDKQDWIFGIVVIAGYALTQIGRVRARAQATGWTAPVLLMPLLKTAAMAIFVVAAVIIANKNTNGTGMPVVAVIMVALLALWSFVVSRTRFGRYVYAVGGNTEAARRAGINVDRIKILVFMICSSMAAIGGVVLVSQLASADTSAGGGTILLDSIAAAVIGGTSLFGGRGHPRSAILGAAVIASVASGMNLINVSEGLRFLVTGLILLAAITIDSLSRRRLQAAGR